MRLIAFRLGSENENRTTALPVPLGSGMEAMKNKWLKAVVRTVASWSASRAIPVAVGLVLLSAAALKVLSRPSTNFFPFDSNWFAAALVGAELTLALGLWTGVWSAAVRLTLICLFSCFAVFNWTQATTGAVSCACFGAIGLSPRTALIVDASLVGLLIYWQPVATSIVTRAQLGIGTLLFCLAGMSAVSGQEKTMDGMLAVSPKVLDLGDIPRGTSGRGEFVIRNMSHEAVAISEVETSCPCLDIRFPETPVEPGGQVRGEAVLDMSREPRFTGNLAIKLNARTAKNKSAFAMVVTAEIRNGD